MNQVRTEDRFRKNLRRELRKYRGSRRMIRRALKFLPAPIRNAISPQKPDPIPPMIAEFAAATPEVTFVQIGSCDGKSGDPINQHIMNYGWRGVVVEPVPGNFELLKKTYEGVEGVTCMEVAISDQPGERTFYHLRNTEGQRPWHQQIGSFHKEHLLKHDLLLPNLADYIEEISVKCMTFEELLAHCGIETLDFLQVDAEGYDLEILKQVDFNRWQPSMVIYEEMHLSSEDRDAAMSLLTSCGYDVTSNRKDAIAVRRA